VLPYGFIDPAAGSKAPEIPRKSNLLDSACIVIGTIIGAGIFIVPVTIARELPSPMLILAGCVIAGVSFLGASAYAELGAMVPHSGGQYIYFREAFGPLTAFVSGWVSFLVVQSRSIAAVSVGCRVESYTKVVRAVPAAIRRQVYAAYGRSRRKGVCYLKRFEMVP
jgi:amino acid transporter